MILRHLDINSQLLATHKRTHVRTTVQREGRAGRWEGGRGRGWHDEGGEEGNEEVGRVEEVEADVRG